MSSSDWISVKDKLPNVDENVFICTHNGKVGVSSMYIPKDCYGNILGNKIWRGCSAMSNSITHWMEIVLPEKK